jgi:tetratricopeptide (TPR) repeat protein
MGLLSEFGDIMNAPCQSAAKARPSGIKMRSRWLAAILLTAATLAAYYPSWHGGLLWDDDAHLTSDALRSFHGLWRIWSDPGATQQYYPLTHTALWIMHRLWGDGTLGYHWVSILLHVLAAILLAAILRRLSVPGSWLAAAIFALHPIQVESVAWISEIKNTLSGAFFFGATLAYLRFDDTRKKSCYASALLLFMLALLGKSVTAVLPAALLVVFWWLRGHLHLKRDVLPLVTFFILGAAAGLFTAWVERTLIGAQGEEFRFTFVERGLIAGRAVWFYLGKLLWPSDLTFLYPRWQIRPDDWEQYLYPLGLIVLFLGAWLIRKRSRAPLAAMLLFCVLLFPALGFVNVFPFRFSFVADHFQYLAGTVIFALAAAALTVLVQRLQSHAHVAPFAAFVILAGVLAAMTWNQSRLYADAETLYRATLQRNPSCWLAHGRLGMLKLKDRVPEAVADFREAIRLNPGFAENHYNLGNALQKMGRPEEAEASYREALRLRPDFAEAHSNLGNALQKMGRLDDAIAAYRNALRLEPEMAEAHNNLGVAYRAARRFADALREWREALRILPDYPDARLNLAVTLQGLGQWEASIMEYQALLRLHPDSALAQNRLGEALEKTNRFEEAVNHYQEALRLQPDYGDARANLQAALAAIESRK